MTAPPRVNGRRVDPAAELGAKLRALRQDAGFTGVQFAEMLGWHHTKLNKLELAKRPPRAVDVKHIADTLGVLDPVRQTLLDLVEATTRPDRQDGQSVFVRCHETLLLNETRASKLDQYELMHIPAALQRPDYTKWILERDRARYSISEPDLRAIGEIKAKRVTLLLEERDDGELRRFRFLLNEALLYGLAQPPAGDDSINLLKRVFHRQLTHMLSVSGRLNEGSNVEVRVISPGLAHVVGLTVGFRLFDERLASVERERGLDWLSDPHEVDVHRVLFEEAWKRAGDDSELNQYWKDRGGAVAAIPPHLVQGR